MQLFLWYLCWFSICNLVNQDGKTSDLFCNFSKKTFYPIIKWKAAKWSFLLALCVAQPNKLRIAHPIVSTFVQIVSTWKDLATKQITECINGNLSSLVVKVNLICGHMFHLMIFILKVQTLKCFNMWTWKKNLIYCKILSVAYRKIQIW